MAAGPYLELDSPAGEEQRFADCVATIGARDPLPGLFWPAPQAAFAAAWKSWLGGLFRSTLAPAMRRAHSHASGGRVEELAQVDRDLDAALLALSPSLAERSRRASEPFFEGKAEMRGQRDWERYRRIVAEGSSPGHLPVVFAFHAALYRLPLAQTLIAYGRLEHARALAAKTAAATAASRTRADGTGRAELLDLLVPEVALALGSNRGEIEPGGTPPALKAL